MTFDFISPLWGWLGLGSGAIAAYVAVAWFFPPFRKYAIAAGLVVLGLLGIYRKGYKQGGEHKQKEWDNAVERDMQKGNQARADAERDVDAGRVRNDKWDRDKGSL